MGGLRYIPYHPQHADELGNAHAEIYYEYLVLCSNSMTDKTVGEWFGRSVSQIQKAIKLKRYVQEEARKLLLKKGWIECKLSSGRSPMVLFKIVH